MESSKRRMPKVDPVVVHGIRYEVTRAPRAHGIAQNSGVISAVDAAGGNTLWTLVVYPVSYDGGEEEDAQDIFITHLAIEPGEAALLVTDEQGRSYRVDLASRAVAPAP